LYLGGGQSIQENHSGSFIALTVMLKGMPVK
jgi:hypothetical protein